MTPIPELMPAPVAATPTESELPAPSFLQRRRHQLIGEIAELREQQRLVLAGRFDIAKLYDSVWIARFRAEWDNRPWEIPGLRATEHQIEQRLNDYRTDTAGQIGNLEALITEAEVLLQELTLACIAEAEQARVSAA